ncbi:60S ribosomal export protein NMD3 [Salinarchaeum laminariae]|uniref:60S ribosomal export protein NMD3 n=1 Tax=Salinarchaeum laminariae TaxID=869888 RepID=UPI0020BD99EE|nr:NMD3-related protein [Salinarchaeum laminariae]
MSNSGAFCPRCGDAVELPRERRMERGEPSLCDACYFDDFELVDAPERIQVLYCSDCGAVKRGKHWEDVGAKDYTDIAIDAVTEELTVHVGAESISWAVEPEQVDETTVRLTCHFSGVVRDTPIEATVVVPAKLASGTCDRCGLIAGDFYAATVQVRAATRNPTDSEIADAREIANEYVAEKEAGGDRDAFVSSIAEVEGGLDVKVSTTQLAREISNRIVDAHGGSVDSSERLITEDGDGNRVYRTAHVVRLPPVAKGDLIDPGDDEGPVLVTAAHQTLSGIRLTSGEEFGADFEDLPERAVLGERRDAEETTLVAVEDEHAIQVLDPETYEATTISRPSFVDPDAETIQVFKHREGLHAVPADE